MAVDIFTTKYLRFAGDIMHLWIRFFFSYLSLVVVVLVVVAVA